MRRPEATPTLTAFLGRRWGCGAWLRPAEAAAGEGRA